MFRGDMAAAAARYRAALGAQPNHVPTLTFLAYLLRDLAPDPVAYHRVQVPRMPARRLQPRPGRRPRACRPDAARDGIVRPETLRCSCR